MARSIAISGKGGTGKTTLTALMIRCLLERSAGPVLAVDADANACLGITLGVEPEGTIADLRDDILNQKTPLSQGAGKLKLFEMGCEQLLTESKGFDLLTMGRPEGPKCYCAVNNVLRSFLDRLSGSYGWVITDNEAGMEHISRRTTNNVDSLFIVGEPTRVGIVTAKRIIELIGTLPISIGQIGVIWNRTGREVDVELNGAVNLGSVPHDDEVFNLSMEGRSVFELDAENPALKAVATILNEKLNLAQKT